MGQLWTIWWVWLSAGLALAVLEVFLPGFLFLGFAAAAAVMALVFLVLPWAPGLAPTLAIFAILSLIAWMILRRVFRAPNDQTRYIDEDINQ
ncbi:hypothetical protein ISM_15495 [Roseovarius nubinhibens ISM]|uniref:NfeD-like C-terminal domain-containing protein n=2 Tax=Roseovarius nubinhibens TaxID=314263 RepID=A3SP93_ROSNI|nr:hypothetical protein ISM_15495 [Roseovarius nubinhibens ISM]